MALSKIIHSVKHPKRVGDPIVNKPLGAGDAVEKVAKPVAKLIDRALGSDIENCRSCSGTPESRKERWNEALPDVSPKGIVKKIKSFFT